jgi:hypothetical protein
MGVKGYGGMQRSEPQKAESSPDDTTTQIPLSFTKILADMHLSEEESNGVRLVAERLAAQPGVSSTDAPVDTAAVRIEAVQASTHSGSQAEPVALPVQ